MIRKLRNEKQTYANVIAIIMRDEKITVDKNVIYRAMKAYQSKDEEEDTNEDLVVDDRKTEEIRDIDEDEKEFSIKELKESISYSTKKIKLRAGEGTAVFYLVKLDESKKYGTKKSEKLDSDKGECIKTTLSDNLVFPSGEDFEGEGQLKKAEIEAGKRKKIVTKHLSGGIKGMVLDEDGNYARKGNIDAFDLDGNKLELVPSSLYLKKRPNEIDIEATVSLDEALDHNIDTHYILFPAEGENDSDIRDLMQDLEDAAEPKFLAFDFNYTDSYDPKNAFLQLVEEGDDEYIMLNAGSRIDVEYCGPEKFPKEEIIVDEFDLDLKI